MCFIMHVYIHTCPLLRFMFESSVMQADVQNWGKVMSVQMDCHSPLKQASKTENSIVNWTKVRRTFPALLVTCLLGKICLFRFQGGKQQGSKGGRKLYVLGTCLSASLCSWQHNKGRTWVISRGENQWLAGLLSENFPKSLRDSQRGSKGLFE